MTKNQFDRYFEEAAKTVPFKSRLMNFDVEVWSDVQKLVIHTVESYYLEYKNDDIQLTRVGGDLVPISTQRGMEAILDFEQMIGMDVHEALGLDILLQ